MNPRSNITCGLLSALLALPALGEASESAQPAVADQAAPAPAVAGLGVPAAAASLERERGAGNNSSNALNGTVAANSATQVATGNNVIQSGSFANTAGLPVVIQNSGANVLIQNATVINLELK
jgi:hypothetical protein